MKTYIWSVMLGCILLLGGGIFEADALMEEGQTVIYRVTHHSVAGDLGSFVACSVAGITEDGYWLQRTTHMQDPDSQPLSITQTLLDSVTHEPLRYIMYRPAKMGRPANVVDLPLERMGKDEVLPTLITDEFSDGGTLEVAAGTFAVVTKQTEKFTIHANPDIPVLGVALIEAPDWTMELFKIDAQAKDFFPEKPPKGGMVYVPEE